jgi:murein DD-endopeptidase MepM/ murein hydrolase activator NlpD
MPYNYVELQALDVSETAMKKLQDRLAQLQQEQADNKKNIEKAELNLASAMQQKELLDKELKILEEEIITTEALIIEMNNNIRETKAQIEDSEFEINKQYDGLKQKLRFNYEEGNANYLEMIFGSENIVDFIINTEYVACLMEYEKKQMDDIKNRISDLKTTNDSFQNSQEALENAKKSLDSKRADREEKASAAQQSIIKLQSDITTYSREYEKNVAEANTLDTNITNILVERARQIEEANRKSAAAAAASKKIYTYSGGIMIWPTLSTNSVISSGFGYRAFDNDFHRGIDIPCKYGDPIYAAADGTVEVSAYHSSFGYYVIIYHGGGLATLYAHNSYLLVSVGEQVKAGDKIAKGGSTGFSTGNHCHFEVRINGSAVNPIDYLS